MKNDIYKAFETANFLKSYIKKSPKIGLMTGTGLGASTEFLDISVSFEYEEIPYFPTSTVESHYGRLHFGDMYGEQIMAMQGRFQGDHFRGSSRGRRYAQGGHPRLPAATGCA